MIKRVTWEEFRSNGFLWAVNSFLHIFGFAIVCKFEGDKVVDVYPARVNFRGFPEESNTKGYISLSKYMVSNANDLLKEANEE